MIAMTAKRFVFRTSSARAEEDLWTKTAVVGIVISLNVLHSLQMHADPTLFFDRSLPLLVLSVLSKKKF